MTPSENIREQILSALQKRDANAALAAEYARLCRELNRRLEQIEEVLDRGDEIQALQMAEIYPPVMDDADVLSFFKSREWAVLCEKHQTAVAPEIRVYGINKLNALYGKGISSTHPIYKELREAILARDDDRALKIARTIESLSPNDLTARSDRERLERKVYTNLIVQLRDALSKNSDNLSITLLESAEQMHLQELADSSPEIQSARKLRYARDATQASEEIKASLPRLVEMQARDDWRGVAESVARIKDLRTRFDVQIDANGQSLLENAALYSDTKRAAAVKESEFRKTLKSFLVCLDDASSRTQARGTLAIPEIRDLLTRLNKAWQTVEAFGLPVEQARVEEASRLIEMLRNELERLQKSRTNTTLVLAAAALVSLAVCGWWITVQYRAGEMTRELAGGRQSRSAASVKRLIADAAQTTLPRFSSKLTAEVENCRKWLEAVDKELDASTLALADLLKRSSNFTSEEPVKLDAEYRGLLARLKELPDEQQKLMQPDLIKLEKTYSDHLAVLGEAFDKSLQEELDAFDKTSEPLQKTGLSLKEIKNTLAAQKDIAGKWDAQIRSQIKDLPVSSILKAKAEADEEKIKSLSLSVAAADEALLAMSKAQKPEAYHEALAKLKEVNLPACSLIPISRIAWNTECTPDSLLPDLLFPGNPNAYQSLKQAKSSDSESRLLFPKYILPVEVAPFAAILNDELTPNVKVFTIEGGDPSRPVYSKVDIKASVDDGDLSVFTGKTYDPKKDSATSPSFSIKTYRANGKGWEKAKKFSEGSDADAAKIYRDLGLKDVVSESMTVHISPLQLLDRLTQSEAKDPVYVAYVIQQLLAMTSSRPYAWGLQYSPGGVNLMKEVDQVVRVTCGSLPQGAWMAPSYQKLAAQLKPLLEKPKRFNGEAQLNKLLAEQVVDTEAFTYAGYVGDDGKPHFIPDLPIPPADLFGITGDLDSRKPACIFRIVKNGDQFDYTEEAKAVPLTPLYQLKSGRENMLEANIHALRLERLRDELTLPPLFAAPTKSSVAL